MSESGAMEFYVFAAANPYVFSFKLMELTGKMPMPARNSLGYH